MKGIFKTLLILMIFFTILGVASTIKFWRSTHLKLDKELHIIAQDAIELSIDDIYKSDHISKLDTSLTEEILFNMIKDKFNLDDNFRPIEVSIIEEQLVITDIGIEEGSYAYDPATEKLKMIQEPYIYLKGYTNKKVAIPFVKQKFPVPFEIYQENKRYDGTM